MEDPPQIVHLKRSRSPSPVDPIPPFKRSKVEDVSGTEKDKSSTNPALQWSDHQSDSNSSSGSSTSRSLPETDGRGPSPVNVVSIDFDSVIAASADSEDDDEVQAIDLNTTLELSEDSSSESSAEEVEVIKEKPKPEPKRNRRKGANQRRNIKDLIGQDSLDVATLAAQKEEWARRERMAAKKKSLGMASLPLSMEQIMERFSSASSVISLTHIGSTDGDKSKKSPIVSSSSRVHPPQSAVEHEVLTLSSDDEDCVPCYESKPSQIQQIKQGKDGPPALLPLSKIFETYGSDANVNRSRCSGGTMIINHHGADVKFEDDDVEESGKSTEEVQEEDDDDCIVLSPPPPDAVEEAEKDEDAFNVPDEFGRVLVNVEHKADEPDIFLAPQIARAVKPHQIGGIRFMYDNVVESLERYNNSPGFGCILAHSMGLGKTIQAAAFCDIFLNHTGANKVLVIVPINTIQNWLNEFNYWLPAAKSYAENAEPNRTGKRRGRKAKQDVPTTAEKVEVEDCTSASQPSSPTDTSHSSGEDQDDESSKSSLKPEETYSRSFEIFVLNETVKNLAARGKIISDWSERRGVLLIGYEMYRMLALKKLRKTGKRKKSLIDLQQEDKTALEEETTLDKIYSCLVDPGPDLVICDEGHKIKNSGASISQALKAIRTKRRIVLTGYPLQNNLMEYHCMCDFIRPNYLGTKAEFANMFERPIVNGQCIDSTVQDKRLMQFRSHVLHSLVEGFVQRRSHLVLQRALPPKEEWVFLVKMSPIQTLLYKEFILFIRHQADMGNSPPNPIKAFAICCKIWNHPDVLYNAVAKKEKVNEQAVLEDLEDLAEEVQSFKKKRGGSRKRSDLSSNSSINNDGLQHDDDWQPTPRANGKEKDNESALSFDWSLEVFKGYIPNILENGTKFELLFTVIDETVKVGDKLLIFSQSLLTLNLMEIFIGMRFGWTKGKEYFRLDGSTTGLERERLIKEFNKNLEIHVFLVSTRAGSLGINLIGANRVVVFDASWNPCHDCQAVCRIYRYGQKKRCQIYRFVTDCSLEKKIYDRQITKRGMANRVVDEMNPDAHLSTKDLSGSLLLELDDLMALKDVKIDHDVSEFDDPVVERLLSVHGEQITKAPFEHESLLIDRKEKKLSKAERRLALRNYELEKKSNSNQTLTPTGRVSHAAYMQNNYTRADYDTQVPVRAIAPALPRPRYNGTTLKAGFRSGFAGSPIYRNDTNAPYPRQGHPRFSRPINSGFAKNDPFASALKLKQNGISVQVIVLKKDSFLPDPSKSDEEDLNGAPDIYLRAGQKVCLIRSAKGAYLKLDNGRMVAVRDRLRGAAQTILDEVPSSEDLTKEQASVIIHSILRPRISSIISAQPQQLRRQLSRNKVFPQIRSKSNSKSPPVAVPSSIMSGSGSPTFSYRDFQSKNRHNLQITNHRNSSGGDVTIWRKDSVASHSSTSTRSDSIISNGSTASEETVPDIEVIKINPNGENERIEPTQLESELLRNQEKELEPDLRTTKPTQLESEFVRNSSPQEDPALLQSQQPPQQTEPFHNQPTREESEFLNNQQTRRSSESLRNQPTQQEPVARHNLQLQRDSELLNQPTQQDPELLRSQQPRHDLELSQNQPLARQQPELLHIQQIRHEPEHMRNQQTRHEPELLTPQMRHESELLRNQPPPHESELLRIQQPRHESELLRTQHPRHDSELVHNQQVRHESELLRNHQSPHNSELLRNLQTRHESDFYRQQQQEQPDYYSSFPTYMGSGLDSPAAMYPPANDVTSIIDALGRSPMSSKYKDPYYPPPPTHPPTQSFNSLRNNFPQHYRNTESPLDQLRNTVSQFPSYKLPEDLVMDYPYTHPPVYHTTNSQQQPRNPVPDSLYSKLLQSQEVMPMVSPPPYNPHPIRNSESTMYTPPSYYGSHNFYDSSASSSMYTKQGYGMSQGNSYPYFTNGGSVTVNDKPAKSIFTPVEQEILDRHRRELL